MEIDRETLQHLATRSLILNDDAYEKESTPPCYLANMCSRDGEFVDFRVTTEVFYSGEKQESVNENLRGILSFMDERRDFEVYLAMGQDLGYQEKKVRIIDREDLAILLKYLEEKLKQRKTMIEAAGVKTYEEYISKNEAFLPYLVLVIDRVEETETLPEDPLSTLITLLLEYADYGFCVIGGSTVIQKTRSGRILQGNVELKEDDRELISFMLSHGFRWFYVDHPAREVVSDPLYRDAVQYALQEGIISTAMLQKKYRIGYSRAARFIDEMYEARIIGRSNQGIHKVNPQKK